MHFTDLRIYGIAIKLAVEIEELVHQIPYYWKINEVHQIKRSSSSVPSNIAEGFAKRIYPREFIRYLNVALGSSDESQSHLIALFKKKHIGKEKFDYYYNQYKNLSIKTLNLIKIVAKNNNIDLKPVRKQFENNLKSI